MGSTQPLQPPNDPELDVKVKKGVERISENLHISANEPSLALYRLQEHVRRAAPPTVARRHHVTQLHSQLQGTCYDVEYALSAVHAMQEAKPTLTSMQELLKEAIFHRQQLKYETKRRRKQSPSMYKRLSSHLPSLDLPDFPDIPDALRETANRVETAIHNARSTHDANSGRHSTSTQSPASSSKNVANTENVNAAPNTIGSNAQLSKSKKTDESCSKELATTLEGVNPQKPELVKPNSPASYDGENGSSNAPVKQESQVVNDSPLHSGAVQDEVETVEKHDASASPELQVDPDDEYDCLM